MGEFPWMSTPRGRIPIQRKEQKNEKEKEGGEASGSVEEFEEWYRLYWRTVDTEGVAVGEAAGEELDDFSEFNTT